MLIVIIIIINIKEKAFGGRKLMLIQTDGCWSKHVCSYFKLNSALPEFIPTRPWKFGIIFLSYPLKFQCSLVILALFFVVPITNGNIHQGSNFLTVRVNHAL